MSRLLHILKNENIEIKLEITTEIPLRSEFYSLIQSIVGKIENFYDEFPAGGQNENRLCGIESQQEG